MKTKKLYYQYSWQQKSSLTWNWHTNKQTIMNILYLSQISHNLVHITSFSDGTSIGSITIQHSCILEPNRIGIYSNGVSTLIASVRCIGQWSPSISIRKIIINNCTCLERKPLWIYKTWPSLGKTWVDPSVTMTSF